MVDESDGNRGGKGIHSFRTTANLNQWTTPVLPFTIWQDFYGGTS